MDTWSSCSITKAQWLLGKTLVNINKKAGVARAEFRSYSGPSRQRSSELRWRWLRCQQSLYMWLIPCNTVCDEGLASSWPDLPSLHSRVLGDPHHPFRLTISLKDTRYTGDNLDKDPIQKCFKLSQSQCRLIFRNDNVSDHPAVTNDVESSDSHRIELRGKGRSIPKPRWRVPNLRDLPDDLR